MFVHIALRLLLLVQLSDCVVLRCAVPRSQGAEPGSITIYKNGERLGVAYSNVTGELRPCVDLFDYGDRVRILKASHPF